jgi:nucleotide-binding universal stress UspA family protein
LAESGVAIRKSVIDGNAQAVIPAHASAEGVLAVLGHLGRPLLRRLARGSSFRDLLAAIVSPILYVPVSRVPLRRLLICSGGLPYATSLEQFAIRLAKAARASITLLHVVEPVAYDYPLAREVESHWRSLLETDTPQGHNLIAAKQEAETQGVPLDVEVRRGSPVREILTQARRGDYDLLGLGSPHSAHSLRHLFMPNVTAEVAEAARCPVLAVRYSAPTGEPTVP